MRPVNAGRVLTAVGRSRRVGCRGGHATGHCLVRCTPAPRPPPLHTRSGQVLKEDDPHHYFLGANGSLTVCGRCGARQRTAGQHMPGARQHPRFAAWLRLRSRGGAPHPPPPNRVHPSLREHASAATPQVGVLPIAYFCSGHVYFTQRMHHTLGIEPYAVHATFQFSGTPGKRHRFREAQLWLEDGSYYHPPGGRPLRVRQAHAVRANIMVHPTLQACCNGSCCDECVTHASLPPPTPCMSWLHPLCPSPPSSPRAAGFLTYVPHIPGELLDKAGPRTHTMELDNTIGHFDLVNHQLREVRRGSRLAT